GDAIALDRWGSDDDTAVARLTEEIDARLRAVTLNYDTTDDASRARALSALFAALAREEPEPVGRARSLRVDVSLARRIEQARLALARAADDSIRARADALVRALAEFEDTLSRHQVALADKRAAAAARYAAPFVV